MNYNTSSIDSLVEEISNWTNYGKKMLDQLMFGLNNYFSSHLLFLIHWTKVLTPYPVAPDG